MSGADGIAFASRKMSATAIGLVSSLRRGVAAIRAFATVISIAATSALSADASARFGLTRTNQKTSA